MRLAGPEVAASGSGVFKCARINLELSTQPLAFGLSMNKYQFTLRETIALWLVYDGICTLCERPMQDLGAVTIDHIIPEHLLGKPEELEEVKQKYQLSAEFDLNDFPNWIPAHPKCNTRKGSEVFEGPAAMCMILGRAGRFAEKARRQCETLKKNRKFARIIASLENNIDSNGATVEQVNLLRILLAKVEEQAPAEAQLFVDHERWKVLHVRPGGLATVTDGENKGFTPVRSSDWALQERWTCHHCGELGPFKSDDSFRKLTCLSCGT